MARDNIFVSSYNFREEVTSQFKFPQKIIINDVILREEVKLDVELSLSQKVEMALMLDELGVHQIQLHTRGVRELVPALKRAGVKAHIDVLNRPLSNVEFMKEEYGYETWQEEIDASVECGADALLYCVHPERLLRANWPEEKILEKVAEVTSYAKSKGAKRIHCFIPDGTRGNFPFELLITILNEAVKHGAERVGLGDTIGIMHPQAMKWFVQEVKRSVAAEVSVHCHNDFGLATANVLASAEGGASILDVAMNGLDLARSGVAALDEVVMSLLCLCGKDVGIKTEKLWATARYFEKISSRILPLTKPITGAANWSKRVDHALEQVVAKGLPAFPFSPALIGYDKSPVNLGRGVGPVGIRYKLSELKLSFPEVRIGELVTNVAAESAQKHRALEDEEFVDLVRRLS